MKKTVLLITFISILISSVCRAEIKSAGENYNDSTMIINEPLATQLGQAIKQGNLDEVKRLLTDNQIDVKSLKGNIQFNLLDMATNSGHFDLVKYFLEQGIEINIAEESGRIALHYAVWHGKTDIAYYLIDHGADVNAVYRANGGLTPLCCAAEYGDLDLVKYLVSHGADIHYKNESSGSSPIRSAAHGGYPDIFKYFSEQLPANHDWQSSLGHAIIGDNPELVKYVVETKKASVNKEIDYWGYPIHAAATRSFNKNNVEIMEYLLKKGARLKDINNGEILPWAFNECNEETIIFLIEKGIKYAPDENGLNAPEILNISESWPPLPGALDRGQFKLAQHLLKTEKDFNFRGMPLVVFFADGMGDSPAIIKFLINNGINKDDYPQAFLRSATNGKLENVKLLFETGIVDINIEDNNGQNAIALTHSTEVASYLIEKGINTDDEIFRENIISNFGVLEAVGKAGIELDIPVEKMNKALLQAARIGNDWIVEYLSGKGADPNYKSFDAERSFIGEGRKNEKMETTPLIENAIQGYEYCSYGDALISASTTRILLKAGANANTTNQEGRTALHYASGDQWCRAMIGPIPMGSRRDREMGFHGDPVAPPNQQHDFIMIALIEGGADMNIQDNAGNTPLMLAAIHNNTAGIRILLKHGAGTDIKNKEGKTFFDIVSDANGIIALLEADLKESISQEVLDRAFIALCTENRYKFDIEKINILLDNGANINCITEKYKTSALHFIIEHGYESDAFYEVVNLLLNRGFDINMKDSRHTVLHIAIDRSRSEKLIKLLLDRGADINAQDEYNGDTPLLQSLKDHNPRFDLFNLLMERGANIHIKNKSQMTALILTNVFGFEEQTDILISNGAKQDLVAEWWLTLTYYSDKFDNLLKLMEQGIDINIQSTYEVKYRHGVKANGMTALMFMASLNDAKTVKRLMSMGADVNIKDNDGRTAIDYPYSFWEGKAETIKVLKGE